MKCSLLNHVIVTNIIGEITQELEKFLIKKKAVRDTNYMVKFLNSYSTFYILMFCFALLLPAIFHEISGIWTLVWEIPGLPFAFLGCQAIIYKSDFSPGPYYGSAILTILSIALPFGSYLDGTGPKGGLGLGIIFWIAPLFYLPLTMMLGWSIGKFLTGANS